MCIPDIDEAALQALLEECETHFLKHVDPLDYRNFEWYVTRSSVRFALGSPALGVVDDLFLAARCLHKRQELHLGRLPNERFLSRRVMPVELGLVSGQPLLTLELAEHYGLPLILLLAQSADDGVFREASLLTSYFQRGSCAVPQDLAGLGAVIYAGAMAAIARGFDDEAILGLNLFADARGPFQDLDAGPAAGLLRRYDQLCLALVCLLRGEWEELARVLGGLADNYEADLRARLGDEFLRPTQPQRYFDLSIVALLAAAALRQVALPLAVEGPIAAYRDLVTTFTTTPPRVLEEPKLSAEDRQLLAAVGMDPDAMEAQLKEQAYEQMEALAHATAAAGQAAESRPMPTAVETPTGDLPGEGEESP